MTESSTPGFVLALIGGILTILTGFWWLVGAGMFAALYVSFGIGWLGGIGIVGAIVYLVLGIITIIASFQMKKPETVKTGGILSLIFGVLSFNVLSIIGGILGIVAGNQ